MKHLVGKTLVFDEDSPSGDVTAGVPYEIEGIDTDGYLFFTDDAGERNFYASNPAATFTIQESN